MADQASAAKVAALLHELRIATEQRLQYQRSYNALFEQHKARITNGAHPPMGMTHLDANIQEALHGDAAFDQQGDLLLATSSRHSLAEDGRLGARLAIRYESRLIRATLLVWHCAAQHAVQCKHQGAIILQSYFRGNSSRGILLRWRTARAWGLSL